MQNNETAVLPVEKDIWI